MKPASDGQQMRHYKGLLWEIDRHQLLRRPLAPAPEPQIREGVNNAFTESVRKFHPPQVCDKTQNLNDTNSETFFR